MKTLILFLLFSCSIFGQVFETKTISFDGKPETELNILYMVLSFKISYTVDNKFSETTEIYVTKISDGIYKTDKYINHGKTIQCYYSVLKIDDTHYIMKRDVCEVITKKGIDYLTTLETSISR